MTVTAIVMQQGYETSQQPERIAYLILAGDERYPDGRYTPAQLYDILQRHPFIIDVDVPSLYFGKRPLLCASTFANGIKYVHTSQTQYGVEWLFRLPCIQEACSGA